MFKMSGLIRVALMMVLCGLLATGAQAAGCPEGYVKTPAGSCVKQTGQTGQGGQAGMQSQQKSKMPTQQSSSLPSSSLSKSNKDAKPQGNMQQQAQFNPQQQQRNPQQQQRNPQQQQQQGKSAGCSQAFANCNAMCSQNYAMHRNPAVYNACLTNCNMGFNTCR